MYEHKCLEVTKALTELNCMRGELKRLERHVKIFHKAIDRALLYSPFPELRWIIFIKEITKVDETGTYDEEIEDR